VWQACQRQPTPKSQQNATINKSTMKFVAVYTTLLTYEKLDLNILVKIN